MNTPYVPRDPGPNPNISTTPPLKTFIILASAAVGIVLIAWVVLGALVGVVARSVPDEFEARLGELFMLDAMQDPEWVVARQDIQAIVDDLAKPLPEREFRYRVVVHENPVPNAFAAPGGTIIVNSGLLTFAESENELAMVLAHELAHHEHRDHLEGMGRGLVLAVILNAVLGGNSGLDQVTGAGAQGLALKMSRDDEREADQLGLLLLEGRYGHVGGAMDFFERVGDQPGGRAATWLSTHPLSSDRIDRIREEIETHHYAVGDVVSMQVTMP